MTLRRFLSPLITQPQTGQVLISHLHLSLRGGEGALDLV